MLHAGTMHKAAPLLRGFGSFRDLRVSVTGLVRRGGSVSRKNFGKRAGNRTWMQFVATLRRVTLAKPRDYGDVCVLFATQPQRLAKEQVPLIILRYAHPQFHVVRHVGP